MERIFQIFENWIDPFTPRPDRDLPRESNAFLRHFVVQSKWVFATMLVLGGLTAIVEAAVFNYVGVLVDIMQTSSGHNLLTDHIWTLVWMVGVVLLLRPVLAILTALVEEQTVVPGFFNQVRWQCNIRIIQQSLSYFYNDFAGRIAAKIWQTGQAVGDFMISLLQIIWYIVVFAISTLVLLAEIDIRFIPIIVVWLTLYSIITYKLVPLIRIRAKEVADKSSNVNGRLVDTYSNIQTVKLFGDEGTELAGTRRGFEIFVKSLQRFTRTLTLIRSLLAVLGGIMIVSVGALSVALWMRDAMTIGETALALSLVLRLNLLLGRMMGQLNGLFRNLGAMQDGIETITRPIAVQDKSNAEELRVEKGRIKFEDVSFKYGEENVVIDKLSLAVEPGEKVGLVGHSGAGKSTMVNLLLRFYDLEGGKILIDGQDISQVTQTSLRRQIGVVSQDTSLMHRSIHENITYGQPETDSKDVKVAAKRAHAHEFIVGLRDQKDRTGYEAHVGERGVKLSGGQRQRIAIARVLLKNAPILILDEATSSLDSEVEGVIQEQLNNLMAGKTVIAIAHRLSTIAAMDRLVVMESGQITEMGMHDELVNKRGTYARLWELQSGGFLVPTNRLQDF